MLIGILSDTHGLLRQEVIDGFEGVDHIIHAGDIDNKQFIDRLEEIAPITVVRGNADKISSSAIAGTGVGQKLGLDKMTGRRLIGGSVTIVAVFGPDLVRSLQGKISMKQLLKNTAIGASGMAGAAIGQAAIPVPVVGAVIGGAVGGMASKAILDQFIEDDAKEMFRILKEEFIDQTMLANPTSEEFEKVTELTVGSKKASKMLQKMYQSKDFRNYARDSIMIPAILSVTKERNKITQRDYNQEKSRRIQSTVFPVMSLNGQPGISLSLSETRHLPGKSYQALQTLLVAGIILRIMRCWYQSHWIFWLNGEVLFDMTS